MNSTSWRRTKIAIAAWRSKVYAHQHEIDPAGRRAWGDLLYGFCLAMTSTKCDADKLFIKINEEGLT